MRGDALMNAVEAKSWDPSVQVLAQFPSVLDMLAQNIEWTSVLGDAAANQQGHVMFAVQRMRAKAYAAGNLNSGEQIKVVREAPDIIVIQPANPQVVFVPAYNPAVVFGAPIVTPGFSAGPRAAGAMISFGAGVPIGAAPWGPSCGWGFNSWRMNWRDPSGVLRRGVYFGNPYWWGGRYRGRHRRAGVHLRHARA